ncbi:hypothetical protein L2E82_41250 [Cichorium intybus]|uniref:Uncharacterized protein n=1 Tax=Cichorium intybus TaxID=13427 RepID=A0ACB9AMT6_CICIN|nr:hypothetical protein L2E82_41250 [Cichorium intybus]
MEGFSTIPLLHLYKAVAWDEPEWLHLRAEWQKYHAALVALAKIADGCSKVMIKNWEQVVTMVLNSFQDPHPRVRWTAINAIGQLSIDLGPNLQVQYHQRVLTALASAMDGFQNPRVQAHVASAMFQ